MDGCAEHLKPVNVKIAQLREALEAVSAEQIYLRARDYRHRMSEFLLTSTHCSAQELPVVSNRVCSKFE